MEKSKLEEDLLLTLNELEQALNNPDVRYDILTLQKIVNRKVKAKTNASEKKGSKRTK
jgi:hypothetical protein